ncbi:hypothetical protein AB6A40_002728 [Gnathostoma spinigerum]|uniref:Nucleotide-diphospho-sugar transferase domain-containing protein n=1 Tax=Gnathostoma spinigerum TaxID=75299 RepID=A0ABD6E7E9_9BILA
MIMESGPKQRIRLRHHSDSDSSSLCPTEKPCSTSSSSPSALSDHWKSQPSDWVPPKVLHFIFYLWYFSWFIFGLLVLRKTRVAIAAVTYVKANSHTVSEEAITASPAFRSLLWSLDHEFAKPPAIFFLNQYALNMTFNFLCNTKNMYGVHERLIFVTLDQVARDVLQEYWPKIHQVYWPTPSLYRPFSFAEGAYQILYVLRANLAASLIKRGKSFWMMQQDTFWRKNLFDLNFEDNHSYDAIFDQIGDDNNSQRAEWINGANFFVHANNYTQAFFEAVARKLAHWYTPDMGVMIHQCHTWGKPNCSYMPHKIAHSWEWLYTDQSNPPYVMQLDCETDGGSKLQQLAKFGFYFMRSDNHRLCNQTAVDVIRHRMETGRVEVTSAKLSWGRMSFRGLWWIADHLLSTPIVGPFLKPYLPLVGFIVLITI